MDAGLFESSNSPAWGDPPLGTDSSRPGANTSGIAFGVPVDWAVKSSGWVTYIAENDDAEETPPASVGSRADPDARDSVATATPTGVDGTGRCASTARRPRSPCRREPGGETLSWTFVGVRGVDDEVPEPTVRKILGTVRLVDGAP
ncbi:hypothetical protein ACFVS7_08725 [Streptomyces rubiginosohelvolus]|uniref:hypothetical protein n=1 Tax=Streptomyces rubiginosohelvolus TaxID=67362 RepID=UPI0036DCBFBB